VFRKDGSPPVMLSEVELEMVVKCWLVIVKIWRLNRILTFELKLF
jgi:hypothetical protein